ncbi:unnamed protein product [Zymoseptoria tritici ST99CH_1A5]|uniref:SIS domain-containing protein n=3 Tax=Zymoseptoria tritici TaxID=1047171 RepID=F9X9P4_ZYMTI|nr:uncharacterized protein MYCGRDRAFT_58228 [Zymoseptoria tritici IPO323]EGP88315.1 hypothetical protein MYCGRDRAFT_58228 [Zymoseptoria tritici IPO323]SMQ50112.1 unnamed protein product [Zymoseptoria tritici ST99CH_3D7]SMR52029.1 unnamed protein product [Zymoseptoria tritici ST99CH_3D1]SMY23784.1 unnamed protein product [Zymoseptoria tritici ST99CH_1A5]
MASQRPSKRQRISGTISPVTPLSPDDEETLGSVSGSKSNGNSTPSSRLLDRAIEVLRVEADALANVAALYQNDAAARAGLAAAVEAIVEAQHQDGKLVVCGVGKSGYIAQKLTATCKSLGIRAAFLHACEAMHGDLGDIRPRDVLLFVSYSGQTPELLNLLSHVPETVRVMAMSSHNDALDCRLLMDRDDGILLPTPIPIKEEDSFGVRAPTTSTTVALAVADMLALTVADELHREDTKSVFQRNHPGGAIGMTPQEVESLKRADVDVSIVALPSPSISAESED